MQGHAHFPLANGNTSNLEQGFQLIMLRDVAKQFHEQRVLGVQDLEISRAKNAHPSHPQKTPRIALNLPSSSNANNDLKQVHTRWQKLSKLPFPHMISELFLLSAKLMARAISSGLTNGSGYPMIKSTT